MPRWRNSVFIQRLSGLLLPARETTACKVICQRRAHRYFSYCRRRIIRPEKPPDCRLLPHRSLFILIFIKQSSSETWDIYFYYLRSSPIVNATKLTLKVLFSICRLEQDESVNVMASNSWQQRQRVSRGITAAVHLCRVPEHSQKENLSCAIESATSLGSALLALRFNVGKKLALLLLNVNDIKRLFRTCVEHGGI